MLTGMRLLQIIDHLESLAPSHLAEDWDRVGLHVGDPAQAVRRGLLCIDLTEPVLAEAVRKKAQLIVAYHPPIFAPLTSLVTTTWKQRMLRDAVKAGIAIYSPHTALDAAVGGVNDFLAAGLGTGAVRPLKPAARKARFSHKVVVFVPAEHVDVVRLAMCGAGAGGIGLYTDCTFAARGEGTFRGLSGAKPAIGKVGRLERVPEVRLETVCDQRDLPAIVAAMVDAHPYEEPAYDVFKREPEPAPPTDSAGIGRAVTLETPVTLDTLVGRVKSLLGIKSVQLGRAARRGKVREVYVCAGAGGSVFAEADGQAEVYLTGEMRHHDVLDAVQRGVSVVLAGHTQTERPYLATYARRLRSLTGRAVTWSLSRADVAAAQVV